MTTRSVTKIFSDDEPKSELLDKYDTFLFDCDGVIWQGAEPLEGVGVAVEKLMATGKKVIFVSNNSTKCRNQYVDKFSKQGMKVDPDQIFSSGYATAKYLESQNLDGKKVYVLGEAGLIKEISAVTEVVVDEEHYAPYNPDAEAKRAFEDVSAVVVGCDFKINMTRFARAVCYLRSETHSPQFILTNVDAVVPINGKAMPEAGMIAAAIAANVGREPDVSCGKPNPLLFDVIRKSFPDIVPEKTLMVGDRLDTDIKFGHASGIDTLLVLTGFQKLEDVHVHETKPTYVVRSVADFFS